MYNLVLSTRTRRRAVQVFTGGHHSRYFICDMVYFCCKMDYFGPPYVLRRVPLIRTRKCLSAGVRCLSVLRQLLLGIPLPHAARVCSCTVWRSGLKIRSPVHSTLRYWWKQTKRHVGCNEYSTRY